MSGCGARHDLKMRRFSLDTVHNTFNSILFIEHNSQYKHSHRLISPMCLFILDPIYENLQAKYVLPNTTSTNR